MDFKISYKTVDQALNAKRMFELKQASMQAALSGKYRDARRLEKEYAKVAISDFETCKTLPFITFKINSYKAFFYLLIQSLKYRLFKAFTKNSSEEKQLAKQFKDYLKTLSPEEIKAKKLDITIPSYYY